MIDFYCPATGIGDSLIRTMTIHELSKLDNVVVHVPKFAWHGKIYKNNEDKGPNPIWLNNPDIYDLIIEDKIDNKYNTHVSGTQHHALDVCNQYGIYNVNKPKLYIYPTEYHKYNYNKTVGVFLRKIEQESCVNYDIIQSIVDILVDSDIHVFQIDGEDRILNNVDLTYKECGVKELIQVMVDLDCVLGPSTGITHIAKALNIPSFDLWDWKRFNQFTPQVYKSYSYEENYNYIFNGSVIQGTTIGSVEKITSDIINLEL